MRVHGMSMVKEHFWNIRYNDKHNNFLLMLLFIGRTPSIWDTYCRTPGMISDGTNGDDACKSYEYYERDVELLKNIGVHKSFNFSSVPYSLSAVLKGVFKRVRQTRSWYRSWFNKLLAAQCWESTILKLVYYLD